MTLPEAIQTYPLLFMLLWAWIGACAGSFLNVCIWRIPNDMSIVSPPSHCPKCNHSIPFYENIPVLSWLILRGKCSSCKEPISIRYLLVELLTALIFLRIWQTAVPEIPQASDLWNLLSLSIAASVLIAAAFTDCDYRIIPDSFVLTLGVSAVAFRCILVSPEWICLLLPLGGACAVFLLLSGLAMLGKSAFKRTAMGWGDIKLLSAMALLWDPATLLFILLLASVLTILCAPVYRKLKPKMRHRALPFAPFIAAAAGLTVLTPLGGIFHEFLLNL